MHKLKVCRLSCSALGEGGRSSALGIPGLPQNAAICAQDTHLTSEVPWAISVAILIATFARLPIRAEKVAIGRLQYVASNRLSNGRLFIRLDNQVCPALHLVDSIPHRDP